jgi:hypothetical protein
MYISTEDVLHNGWRAFDSGRLSRVNHSDHSLGGGSTRVSRISRISRLGLSHHNHSDGSLGGGHIAPGLLHLAVFHLLNHILIRHPPGSRKRTTATTTSASSADPATAAAAAAAVTLDTAAQFKTTRFTQEESIRNMVTFIDGKSAMVVE